MSNRLAACRRKLEQVLAFFTFHVYCSPCSPTSPYWHGCISCIFLGVPCADGVALLIPSSAHADMADIDILLLCLFPFGALLETGTTYLLTTAAAGLMFAVEL
jgi:uncharacterized membrane protein